MVRTATLALIALNLVACARSDFRPAVELLLLVQDSSGNPAIGQPVFFSRGHVCPRSHEFPPTVSTVTSAQGEAHFIGPPQRETCGFPLGPTGSWILPTGRQAEEIVISLPVTPDVIYNFDTVANKPTMRALLTGPAKRSSASHQIECTVLRINISASKTSSVVRIQIPSQLLRPAA